METDPESGLIIRRIYNADRKTLFKALTDPEILKQWFFPVREEGWSATVDFNAEVGKNYSITMHDPDGKDYVHSGEFREIIPGQKLVFTWNSHAATDSVVTIELKKVENGTEFTLVHNFLPEDEKEGHKEGWIELLENLKKLLKSKKETENV